MQNQSLPPTTKKLAPLEANPEAVPNLRLHEKTLNLEVGPKLPNDNLIGMRFGRLTVIEFAGMRNYGVKKLHKRAMWTCKCECGTEKIICKDSLVQGSTRSCGCFHKEVAIKVNTSHGQYRTRAHITWMNMKSRCLNPQHPHYQNWGGRGIKVCERWLKFENFLEDMGERPRGLTLERIDNSLGYCKDNCIYATPTQQSRNRRCNRYIVHNGERRALWDWGERTGLGVSVIEQRLDKLGWSIEEALTTPLHK